jgi:hypothetical protein
MSRRTPSTRAGIEAALAEEEARLGLLDVERTGAIARAEALRAELTALEAAPPIRAAAIATAAAAPHSAAEKVKLFRELFRGRDDVYPTRFVSKKTGKPGYAHACANKFVVGVCPLPKVKCGDCSNQAFRPVDDLAVRAHLQSKHVMGVYPMLPNEACWFLAVDFDKGSRRLTNRPRLESASQLDDDVVLPVVRESLPRAGGDHPVRSHHAGRRLPDVRVLFGKRHRWRRHVATSCVQPKAPLT